MCACSLVVLYLLVSFVLCPDYRTARTAPSLHPRASLGKESAGSASPSVAEERSPAVSEPPGVGLDTPFHTHFYPRLVNELSPIPDPYEGARASVIPKIVVQDFSTEDGSIHYKTPEYDLRHTSKRRRRPSRTHNSTSHEDYLTVTTRPSFRLPPALGMSTVGESRPLYLVEGKRRRSDILVRDLAGFSGRERVLGDVVAKDGSFVIVGL